MNKLKIIEFCGLQLISVRSANVLTRLFISKGFLVYENQPNRWTNEKPLREPSLEELESIEFVDLLRMRNCGRKTTLEIERAFINAGIMPKWRADDERLALACLIRNCGNSAARLIEAGHYGASEKMLLSGIEELKKANKFRQANCSSIGVRSVIERRSLGNISDVCA
jgi:hypothetical protein